MSYYSARPPLAKPSRVSSVQAPAELPPESAVSPRLAGSVNSAQRYLQNRDKKLFDSADYFSTSPTHRAATPPMSAFDQVGQEANRLTNRGPRASALSCEMYKEVEGDLDDVSSNSADEVERPKQVRKSHSMRRNSMEEFFVEENSRETVKHAILEKPTLKRWDSGDFFSSPKDYRKMLATQAKEVLRNALEHAEEDCRPRRHRRSSLSMEEPSNFDGEDRTEIRQ